MSQQSAAYPLPEKLLRPGMFTLFLHAGKTLKLIGALLKDQRVSVGRKVLFFGAILFVLVLLLFPDLFGEAVLSVILPVVGTVVGIPLDAGFDWIVFAIVVVNLLKVFPADLVSEHYGRIFKKSSKKS